MKPPRLGKIAHGGALRVNVAKLIFRRLIILADSGAGKSFLIRKVCEAIFGAVIVIVFDREGEYESLREKFPFLIVGGENGDVPIATATAPILARRLMETSTSAIINLSEMRAFPRQRNDDGENRQNYFAAFAHAMLELPKALRKPVFVIVDEAQDFAPEGGKEPPSLEPAIGLNFQGRKRSLGVGFASQASVLISKNAIRGIQNRIVGRTVMAADQRQIAKDLRLEDSKVLEDLKDGEFFVIGPAFSSKKLVRMQADMPITRHPEPGSPQPVIPAPPAKLKKVLAELHDLAGQARTEARTAEEKKKEVDTLKARVAALEGELKMATKRVQIEVEVEKQFVFRRGEVAQLAKITEKVGKIRAEIGRLVEIEAGTANALFDRLSKIGAKIEATKTKMPSAPVAAADTPARQAAVARPVQSQRPVAAAVRPNGTVDGLPDTKLAPGERAVLTVIVQYAPQGGAGRDQISVITGYKRTTRNAYINRLAGRGYVSVNGEVVQATAEGVDALGDYEPIPTTPSALVAFWKHRLPEGEAIVLDVVLRAGHAGIARDAISEAINHKFKRTTRNAYIQRMVARRIVVTPADGLVRAAPGLLP